MDVVITISRRGRSPEEAGDDGDNGCLHRLGKGGELGVDPWETRLRGFISFLCIALLLERYSWNAWQGREIRLK